jgi:dihydrodipicolinate synthase/N-acetylneuraminate lyase
MALGSLSDPVVGAVKVAMAKLGVPISPAVRGPALPAPSEAYGEIEAVLEGAGLLPVAEGA